ncbi:unnamed protein product [Brassica rapa]|uniref:Uncharacterized protein n=2 Tax=Brassica TaxID=3705 RepID=A0A3P6DDD7_BRACM|nr:unnamed protein product [Brassica napus]CAG7912130.1 unnamed protein product [Brassica rapa]VDD21291.1 unnamed protein product [Brassica rapa]
MDGDQDNIRQVEEHDDGSCQDISPANKLSAEITEEISPSQHERWRDLVFDIQLRPQENDFLRANGYFTPPLLVPCRKGSTSLPWQVLESEDALDPSVLPRQE